MSAFTISALRGRARRGRISTRHGVIETPAFMPVGTVGSVKALDTFDLMSVGAAVMLANTYHLLLRPGPEALIRLGGLHRFAGVKLPILTDSGGFQVMSLAGFRELSDEGARFRSHLDGREYLLSPEEAMRVQAAIGSDIRMVLDVCPAAGAARAEIERAMELTRRWAERTAALPRPEGALRFGIVQGGFDAGLRRRSAAAITPLAFDGFAIGGLSVGEPENVMFEMLGVTAPLLPEDRPRYLMGVGKPAQILEAVRQGVDLFDCVLPTRVARHGTLWTRKGLVRINRAEFAEDLSPVDSGCSCLACAYYSRAYLRHLYRNEDPLYLRLASLHNLAFLLNFMRRIRDAIELDELENVAAPDWDEGEDEGEAESPK